MKKSLLITCLSLSLTIYGQSWNISGNSGTNSSTNFIGTMDNQPLIFKTNNIERMRITPDAIDAIGSTSFSANATNKDLLYVHNDLDNASNGIDLLFMRYGKYQPNNPSIMTIAGLTNPSNYEAIFNVRANGNIGIGVANPQYKLDVVGKSSFSDNMKITAKLEAKEVKVTLSPTADFVFEENYNLPKLEAVEKHIKEKKHLPEIASAKVMEKDGVNIGEFQIKLLQKIEELTLYSIEQNKQIKSLQEENKTLKSQSEDIKELKKQVQQLLSTKK